MYLIVDMKEMRVCYVYSDMVDAEHLRRSHPDIPYSTVVVLESNEAEASLDLEKLWEICE